MKKKPQVEDEDMEDLKEEQEIAAAHFTSDSSKYNIKTHPHYNGKNLLFLNLKMYYYDNNLTKDND